MAGYHRPITFVLPAAATNGIAQSQAGSGAGSMTLNGSLVSGGVANLVTAQRVGIYGASDNSGITFTITGTGFNGVAQSEVLTGGNAVLVNSVHDYLTVTSITRSGSVTGTVIIGTNAVGSSQPFFVDAYVNAPQVGVDTDVTGTVNYSIQFSTTNLSPLWDLNANTPTWWDMFGFSGITAPAWGTLNQPCTLMRITINSGTGTVKARFRQNLIAQSS